MVGLWHDQTSWWGREEMEGGRGDGERGWSWGHPLVGSRTLSRIPKYGLFHKTGYLHVIWRYVCCSNIHLSICLTHLILVRAVVFKLRTLPGPYLGDSGIERNSVAGAGSTAHTITYVCGIRSWEPRLTQRICFILLRSSQKIRGGFWNSTGKDIKNRSWGDLL